MQVHKSGALTKKLGAKNMQNLVQFHTSSDFDREYLQNKSRYPKLERNMIGALPCTKNPVNFGPQTK